MLKRRSALIVLNARDAVKPVAEFVESAVMGMAFPSWAAGSAMPSIWRGSGKGRKARMKKVPAIDLSECSDCETCLALCPAVFVRNTETGFIEIQDMEEYPEEKIYEVMSFCPQDCISFSEDA